MCSVVYACGRRGTWDDKLPVDVIVCVSLAVSYGRVNLPVLLLNFLAGTNIMLADIPTYSALDFPWQILQSNEKGFRNLQRDRHLGSFR